MTCTCSDFVSSQNKLRLWCVCVCEMVLVKLNKTNDSTGNWRPERKVWGDDDDDDNDESMDLKESLRRLFPVCEILEKTLQTRAKLFF